eukprot:g8946.t1
MSSNDSNILQNAQSIVPATELQFSDLLMVPSESVESTGEVDGQFKTFDGSIDREDDACLGFFTNKFQLPSGQVPFLKIIVEDTISGEEDYDIIPLQGENSEEHNNHSLGDNIKQSYIALDSMASPSMLEWFLSKSTDIINKNMYIPQQAKSCINNYLGLFKEKCVPKALSFRPTNTLIKAVAFHPYLKRIAVARDDDIVCVYDLQRTMWLPLRLSHEFQKGIKCLEWQPMSGSRLAIGCANGVCLWRITNDEQDIGKAWMRLYATARHHDIISISWCPRGDFIASSSPSSSDVMIWNVDSGLGTPLACAYGHGVNVVRWSYNSYYLFAGAFTNKIFIWETRSWRCESWALTNGMCQCATWSPDGELIVFSESGTSSLWTLALHHTPPRIDGRLIKIKLDVSLFWKTYWKGKKNHCDSSKSSNVNADVFQDEDGNDIFLNVRELAWSFDRRGQRLALTVTPMLRNVKDRAKNNIPTTLDGDELIMIYNVYYRPDLRFSPSGFFRSSNNAKRPYEIHFWPACRNGALLVSAWMNGVITVYPLLYRCALTEE